MSYLLKYPFFSYKYLNLSVQINLLRLSLNKNYKLSNGLINLVNLKIKSKGNNLSSPLPTPLVLKGRLKEKKKLNIIYTIFQTIFLMTLNKVF